MALPQPIRESTRIFTEEGELKEPEPSEDEFSETWQISEEVQFKLSIFLFDEQTIINLSYSNQTEEWQPRQWKDNK